MNNIDLEILHNWFDKYVNEFYCKNEYINENILLKKEHTKRVSDNIKIIGESLNLSENELYIADIIALFHDIGRFEQFKRYKTFNDAISENHAMLGISILDQSKVLNRLNIEETQFILKAIQYHNMFKIPKEDEKTIMFSNLIRDADKLDIYKVFTDYYAEMHVKSNDSIEHALPDNNEYSNILVEDILNNRNSDRKNAKSRYDMRLLTLTWIFDINYKKTLELIREREYIEKTFEALPKNKEMEKIKEHILAF